MDVSPKRERLGASESKQLAEDWERKGRNVPHENKAAAIHGLTPGHHGLTPGHHNSAGE